MDMYCSEQDLAKILGTFWWLDYQTNSNSWYLCDWIMETGHGMAGKTCDIVRIWNRAICQSDYKNVGSSRLWLLIFLTSVTGKICKTDELYGAIFNQRVVMYQFFIIIHLISMHWLSLSVIKNVLFWLVISIPFRCIPSFVKCVCAKYRTQPSQLLCPCNKICQIFQRTDTYL